MAEHEKSHIVVLGGGFGGLTFCQYFHHPAARVTLVDRTNHHLFQPLLYQVATAGLSAPEIAQPIRSILARRSDVTVLMDNVVDLNLANRQVFLEGTREVGRAVPSAPRASEDVQNVGSWPSSHGALGTARPTLTRADGLGNPPDNRSLRFDYLVLALGGITSYFGHPEWEEFAPGLKTSRMPCAFAAGYCWHSRKPKTPPTQPSAKLCSRLSSSAAAQPAWSWQARLPNWRAPS